MIARIAIIAALMLCAPLDARAQPASASILGDWEMEALLEPARDCTITGQAHIDPGDQEGLRVRLSVRETCRSGGDWRAEQRCRALRKDAGVHIFCTVVSDTPYYYRDNFALDIRSSQLMEGWLLSSLSGHATWRRPAAPLVS
jgi:hypothetical protein